jgi:hypothetical protein
MSHYDLPNVASFSGLSIFYCPISVLYHLFVLLLTIYHSGSEHTNHYTTDAVPNFIKIILLMYCTHFFTDQHKSLQCPISVLYHLFVLLLNKTTYHDSIFRSSSTELVLISMNVKLSSFCLSKCFEQPRNVLVF